MSYGGPDDYDLPADPWADEDPAVDEPAPSEDVEMAADVDMAVDVEVAADAEIATDVDARADLEMTPDLEAAQPDFDATPPEPDPAVVADLEAVTLIERDLQGVDAALRRLDDGTYGSCVSCGRPIEAATLETHPIEDHCVHCDPAQGRLAGL